MHLHLTRLPLCLFSHQVVSDSLQPHGLQHTRLPFPFKSFWKFPLAFTFQLAPRDFAFVHHFFKVLWDILKKNKLALLGEVSFQSRGKQLYDLPINSILNIGQFCPSTRIVFPLVCVCVCLSCVWLCATMWTVAHQALLSMEFTRQQYWSGLPFPPPSGSCEWNLLNLYSHLVKDSEKAMAPHSSTLAWKIPQTEEPGR